MTQLSRRELLVGAAAVAAAASIPALPGIASPVEVMPSWAVGTPGEFDWQRIVARTYEEAIHDFVCEEVGGDGCEEGGKDDCECEWCFTIGGLEAERVPVWDGKDRLVSADWLHAGMGVYCSRCGEETFRHEGGKPVGDDAICSECMTLADWDIVDPEHAAELREEAGHRLSLTRPVSGGEA